MPADLPALFARYRDIAKKHAKGFDLLADDDDKFTAVTPWVHPRNKKPQWLAMVEQRKDYVSVHVMPIYVFPDLAKSVSPTLAKRLVGKSCFKFKSLDAAEAKEIDALLKEGAKRLKQGPDAIKI